MNNQNEKISQILKRIDDCDSVEVLALSRKMKKIRKSIATEEVKCKVAVLGSASIKNIVPVLDLFLYKEGIMADIYEGEYDGVAMDILDPNSEMYRFKPTTVFIMLNHRDIKIFPALGDTKELVKELVAKQIFYYKGLCEKLLHNMDCKIFITNFAIPYEREFGNLEARYYYSKSNYYRLLNLGFMEELPTEITILDMEALSCNAGKTNWFDEASYFLSKEAFHINHIKNVVGLMTKLLMASKGIIRKCLVLDLDNTLWGGVVADEGASGIQIDPNHAIGEAYRFFQTYLCQLKNRGVILAICSKNDIETAKEPFISNDKMILKLEDISCFVANWEDKAGNIRMIAKELNIGLDSIVFFDDNPAERELIKTYLPQVQVINVPNDPAEYVKSLEEDAPFEWLQITKEDFNRSKSYHENSERKKMEDLYVDYDSYLSALEMRGEITELNENQIPRFVQLINKSNQFNFRTIRYSENEIKSFMKNELYQLFCVSLTDKFSDYGIIACIILKKEEENCFIDSWVMSCRVLKRGVEYLTLNHIKEEAKKMGCTRIVGEYIPTAKNKLVEKSFEEWGFQFLALQNKTAYLYVLDLNEMVLQNKYYIMEQ